MDGPVMDFPARLKQATSMAGNLLTDSHVYARKEILKAAKISAILQIAEQTQPPTQ